MNTRPAVDLEGRVIRISEADDPRLADYREVRDADLAGRRGAFVAEGEVVLRVLVERSPYRARSVLVAETRLDKVGPLLSRLPAEIPVFVVEQAIMNHVVGFNIHRGLLAVGERPAQRSPEELLRTVEAGPAVVVGLEALANHDNLGGVFRNAAAFGAPAVLLDERCCDPLYRKAIRVSVGAALFVPYARADSAAGLLGALADAGFATLALTPRGGAADLAVLARSGRLPERVALLLGTEGAGLSEALIEGADHVVRVDIASGFDSLNVATTCGIALHEVRAACSASG